jgi:hypothetical protein
MFSPMSSDNKIETGIILLEYSCIYFSKRRMRELIGVTLVMHLVSTTIRQNITTVAGSSNGSCATLSGGLTTLHQQAGIAVSNNGTLYVADGSPANVLLAFEPNNFTAKQLILFSNWPTYIFINAVTSLVYVTLFNLDYVQIWPSNQTIPRNLSSTGVCSMTDLFVPTDMVIDSLGNIYIASYACSWVTKWAPSATNSTLVAGSLGGAGSNSLHLHWPYGLSLDETHSLLYVVDRYNSRVQKFTLGNLNGVTVAGGNGAGAASNQLDMPTTMYVSQLDQSYYICDCGNNRIVKWAMNATYGVTIAGSSTGVAGSTLYLLNQPYDIWVHPNETYMLISDTNNCRVQKYLLQ